MQNSIFDHITNQNSIYDLIPASVYWKNTDGEYLGCNSFAFKKYIEVGLNKISSQPEMTYKTDHDLFPLEAADSYRHNDLSVIYHGEEITTEETITVPNGNTLIQLSSKKPLIDTHGKISGILGVTIDITNLKNKRHTQLISMDLLKAKGLSQRQADCLFLMAKGMTTKQIAYSLSLSVRTVENYIQIIKEKFGCNTKSAVIMKVLA